MDLSKVWDMKTQLSYGLKAELEFCERYHRKLTKVDEHRLWDFECGKGIRYELKTDTYPLSKTPNFFMERWSVLGKDKPGGPWQALSHEADVFIYYFASDKTYFQFDDIAALVGRLDVLTKKSGMVYIPNKGWTTAGYKVKRADLEDLYDEYNW